MKMILILLIIASSLQENDDIIEDFIGQPIKIFFTSYSHYHLVQQKVDQHKKIVNVLSKFLDPSKNRYDDRARINRNGDDFEISIGGDGICKENKKITVCEKDKPLTLWSIQKQEFGFQISANNECISKISNSGLDLRDCTGSDDQLFDFKLIQDLSMCDAVGHGEKSSGNKGKKSKKNKNIDGFQIDDDNDESELVDVESDDFDEVFFRNVREAILNNLEPPNRTSKAQHCKCVHIHCNNCQKKSDVSSNNVDNKNPSNDAMLRPQPMIDESAKNEDMNALSREYDALDSLSKNFRNQYGWSDHLNSGQRDVPEIIRSANNPEMTESGNIFVSELRTHFDK